MPAIANSKCGNPLIFVQETRSKPRQSPRAFETIAFLLSDRGSDLVAGEGLEPPTSGL